MQPRPVISLLSDTNQERKDYREHLINGIYDHYNFSACNLSGAMIVNASFKGANLCNVRCKSATFTLVNLCGAKLNDARFDGSCIQNTQLNGADLTNACLCQARLEDVDLSNAILVNSDLRSAIFTRVLFDGAEFFPRAEILTPEIAISLLNQYELFYKDDVNFSILKSHMVADFINKMRDMQKVNKTEEMIKCLELAKSHPVFKDLRKMKWMAAFGKKSSAENSLDEVLEEARNSLKQLKNPKSPI